MNDSAEALVLLSLKKRSAVAVQDIQVMCLDEPGHGFEGIQGAIAKLDPRDPMKPLLLATFDYQYDSLGNLTSENLTYIEVGIRPLASMDFGYYLIRGKPQQRS